jgi:hypothetical protein
VIIAGIVVATQWSSKIKPWLCKQSSFVNSTWCGGQGSPRTIQQLGGMDVTKPTNPVVNATGGGVKPTDQVSGTFNQFGSY